MISNFLLISERQSRTEGLGKSNFLQIKNRTEVLCFIIVILTYFVASDLSLVSSIERLAFLLLALFL